MTEGNTTTVVFGFKLYELIQLKDLATYGHITGFLMDSNGPQLRVTWWINGERKTEWLFPFEIKRVARKTSAELFAENDRGS